MHYIFLHLLDNKVFYLVTIFTLLHHNLRHFHQTPRANVVNVPRDGPRRSVYKYLQAQRNVSQPFFRTGTPTYLNIYKSKTKAAGGTWRLPQHCQARNKNPRNTLRDIWNFILFFFFCGIPKRLRIYSTISRGNSIVLCITLAGTHWTQVSQFTLLRRSKPYNLCN